MKDTGGLVLLSWELSAWQDYLYWQKTDKNTYKKINSLIKDTLRNPYDGIGKPEALMGDFSGYWSRRITKAHRLVYTIRDSQLIIASCRYHY